MKQSIINFHITGIICEVPLAAAKTFGDAREAIKKQKNTDEHTIMVGW